jgi:peroxiredoxin Q/BCP
MTSTLISELQVGMHAPDFVLSAAEGYRFRLSEHHGQAVIVFFFPAAGTPGCTTEACDFRDSLDALAPRNVLVVGVSPDPVDDLRHFAREHTLNYLLLSDPGNRVARAYGAYGKKNLFGKVTRGVIRSTIVVGREGRVAYAAYNVQATGHVAKLRRDLGLA